MPKSYSLHEPRDFVLIEEGVLRSDFGCAFGVLADLESCPPDIKPTLMCLQDKAMDRTLTDKDIYAAKEACRQATWKYLHLKKHGGSTYVEYEKVASAAMMILSGLVGVLETSHQRKRVPLKESA